MKQCMTICVGLVVVAGMCGCSTGSREFGVSYNNREGIIIIGGQPVMRYAFGEVPFKPYVQELRSPAGVQVLRDAPADHLHHHALMLGSGWTVWISGRRRRDAASRCTDPISIMADGRTGEMGRLVEKLDWMGPGGVLLAGGAIDRGDHPGGATVLTWRSRLTRPEGMAAAKLTGSHYFGLGMRFAESMDTVARFVYVNEVEGPVVRGDERLTPGRWCAVQGQVGGKDVAIAMFDSPANPRPVAWFTMREPFTYLSATMRLHETPMELKAGEPMNLRYGVAVWDGTVGPQEIARVYGEWRERGSNY